MVSIINELKRIAVSEINFSISYFYDDCWTIRLGDELNGYTYEETFDSIEKGINALIQAIIKQHPNSDYITQLHKRTTMVFHGLHLFKE